MTQHPLEQTLAHLADADEHIRTWLLGEPDSEPGWLTAEALAAEGSPHLPEALRRVLTRYKTDDGQAPAALWFGQYAFALAAVPVACYLAARRVPGLAPEDVWVRFGEDGDVGGLAWRSRSFAGLPDDPESHHPDCTVLASRDALRTHLREQLVAHLTPLVEAVRRHSSFGRPGMWALAADSCASAFTWVGGHLGDEAGGAAEARRFAAEASPLPRARDFIPVEHCGLHYLMLDRLSCCLYYKVEGGGYCSTCPHRPMEERVERIKAWLEKRAAGEAEA